MHSHGWRVLDREEGRHEAGAEASPAPSAGPKVAVARLSEKGAEELGARQPSAPAPCASRTQRPPPGFPSATSTSDH